MKIGWGLITCQLPPDDPRNFSDLYQQAVELCVLAETAGLDSVWTSEHHFADDGYLPSSLTLSAAIASRTSRIEVGTGVVLAPLYNPLRLAEDAATVDCLSGGRFTLGIGAGWRDEEFELLGVALSDRAKLMRETVKTLRDAWSSDSFNHNGHLVYVTPKPSHHIPIVMGGFDPRAIERAGRIGDGFIGSSSGTSGIEGFKQARELTLAGLKKASRNPAEFSYYLHVPVFVGDFSDVAAHYHYIRWKYADMREKRGSTIAASPPRLDAGSMEELRATIVCGSPTEVAQQIQEFADALGDDIHFICRNYFPGMPFDTQREQLRLIGEQVAPILKGSA